MDYLFERKPEYDENGQIVSHTTPKIVWVIMAGALFYCFRGKVTGQKGGGFMDGQLWRGSGEFFALLLAGSFAAFSLAFATTLLKKGIK